jgi:hypothetical protein
MNKDSEAVRSALGTIQEVAELEEDFLLKERLIGAVQVLRSETPKAEPVRPPVCLRGSSGKPLMQRVCVEFPADVSYPAGWEEAFGACLDMVCKTAIIFSKDRVRVSFEEGVENLDGIDHVIVAMVDLVCKTWERENPTMVMWPCFIGLRPVCIGGEIVGTEDDEFVVGCEAQEDLLGRNPFNPNREALKAAGRALAEQMAAQLAGTPDNTNGALH